MSKSVPPLPAGASAGTAPARLELTQEAAAQGVHRLPPGHSLTLSLRSCLSTRETWAFELNGVPVTPGKQQEAQRDATRYSPQGYQHTGGTHATIEYTWSPEALAAAGTPFTLRAQLLSLRKHPIGVAVSFQIEQ